MNQGGSRKREGILSRVHTNVFIRQARRLLLPRLIWEVQCHPRKEELFFAPKAAAWWVK